MNEIEKPITVAREDFIRDLNNLVNNSGIPPIILEPIFANMHRDIAMVLKQQTDNDRKQYNEALMAQHEAKLDETKSCESAQEPE